MSMSKIYVVTVGQWDDYHICDVFDDEELAGLYVTLYGGRIEKYELNPMEESLRQGRAAWCVWMDYWGNQPSWEEARPVHTDTLLPDEIRSVFVDRPNIHSWYLIVHCWAKDSQDAVSIANTRRAQIITLGRWPTQPAGKDKPSFVSPLGSGA